MIQTRRNSNHLLYFVYLGSLSCGEYLYFSILAMLMSENPSQSSLVSDVIYRFRQAQKRSSNFFPAPLFNKTKALTMDKVRGNIDGFSFATSPCPCRGLIIK